MNEEQYRKRLSEIDKNLSKLKGERTQLQLEYVASIKQELANRGISYGSKVLVKHIDWHHKEAEVECYYYETRIEWDYPRHHFRKIKKDGTMSQREHYIGGGDILSIELIK